MTEANPLTAAVQPMVDLSTGHITEADLHLLQGLGEHGGPHLPRCLSHKYGVIVFLPAWEEAKDEALRELGVSEAFINVFRYACELEDAIVLNFDQDASLIDGLPVFDW